MSEESTKYRRDPAKQMLTHKIEGGVAQPLEGWEEEFQADSNAIDKILGFVETSVWGLEHKLRRYSTLQGLMQSNNSYNRAKMKI